MFTRIIAALVVAFGLGVVAAPAQADVRPVKSVSGELIAKAWHCGSYFHGSKVRGYEIRTVFTRPVVYAHVASLPSFSPGLNRVVVVAACQL
jgi:hypothetical protein